MVRALAVSEIIIDQQPLSRLRGSASAYRSDSMDHLDLGELKKTDGRSEA
jgi:hypothetical protein